MGDEFDFIARVLRPLTRGAPEALELRDDAALIAGRPGFELVITQDALVAGVHVLPDDPLDLVAQKLLRTNLSDLAAKGAEPYGYFLSVAWPAGLDAGARSRLAEGLARDQDRYDLSLFGGDTVSTSGPLTLSATLLGWVPAGAMVRRGGARPGDRVLVSGTIGDGGLGLRAARGELAQLGAEHVAALARRYHLPEPRLAVARALRRYASAAADVSDGLAADAGHIAAASDVGMRLELNRMPVSAATHAWLHDRDPAAARAELAGLGDDYELIVTVRPDQAAALILAAAALGVAMTDIGEVVAEAGVTLQVDGRPTPPAPIGWTHF